MAALELLKSQGLRLDGRRADELRRIRCRLGVFGQADGSSSIQMGNTKVLAAVYGPRDARSGANDAKLVLNVQYSERRRGRGGGGKRDRRGLEAQTQLKQSLEAAVKCELYPRSRIDVFLEVLQADGGEFCACVNAASLALVDAGVPMRDVVCAATASIVDEDAIADVSGYEGGAELALAMLPKSGEIVLLEMTRRFHLDHLDKVMEAAENACKKIYETLEAEIRKHVAKEAAKLGWQNES